MSSTEIVWDIPDNLYQKLIDTQQDLAYPDLESLLTNVVQRFLAEVEQDTWQQEFKALQKQVRVSGGFKLGSTKEEVIEALRKQRSEIFDSEYADLYR